jgi:magnesium chelatase subunit I
MDQQAFEKQVRVVPGLDKLIKDHQPSASGELQLFLMEFALHGLAEYSMISKHNLTSGLQFKDLLSSMFTLSNDEGEDDEEITRGGAI